MASLDRARHSGRVPGVSLAPAQRAADLISAAVAAAFTVPISELRASSRQSAPVALARQSAMYLAHVTLGLSFAEVGRAFGRDRTTAAHACRRIEDRRTENRLDTALAELEQAVRRDLVSTLGAAS
ncbi:MAG: helix-turn-helix domain-containing protein [Alphaproteobacteria bacterium]